MGTCTPRSNTPTGALAQERNHQLTEVVVLATSAGPTTTSTPTPSAAPGPSATPGSTDPPEGFTPATSEPEPDSG